MIGNFIGVLFDGIAYGSLLFLISIGLSVTMGLMNFVNLAHGAFAMLGGYVCVDADDARSACRSCRAAGRLRRRGARRRGARADAVPAAVSRRAISTRCCSRSASCSCRSPARPTSSVRRSSRCSCRRCCAGRSHLLGLDFGAYRLFLIARRHRCSRSRCSCLIERTRFGARSARRVDNQQASAGLGINVDRVFSLTFALGSGLAGPGRRARHRRARASTRRFRSSTWCTSCWSSPSAAPARSRARWSPRYPAGRVRRRRQVLRAADRRASSSTR